MLYHDAPLTVNYFEIALNLKEHIAMENKLKMAAKGPFKYYAMPFGNQIWTPPTPPSPPA